MSKLPPLNELTLSLKQPLTIECQINKLLDKGLFISDKEKAKNVLLSVNYYHFVGYLHESKEIIHCPDDNEIGAEIYDTSYDFSDIHNLINIDSKIRGSLIHAIDYFERDFKTKIAYQMSIDYMHGNIAYMYSETFNNCDKHAVFLKIFKDNVSKNKKTLVVKHHRKKYNGHFPVWVAVEFMTLGNLEVLYSLLNDTTKETIARYYNLSVPHFENHLMTIRKLRNLVAHNSRLYNLDFYPYPNTRVKYKSGRVFDSIVSLQEVVSDDNMWNNDIVSMIEELFHKYPKYNPRYWGFPDNWKKRLTKKPRLK